MHLANAVESSAEEAKLSEAALKRARNVHKKQMKRKDREVERYKGRTSKIANDIEDALNMEFSPSHDRKEPNNLERITRGVAKKRAAEWKVALLMEREELAEGSAREEAGSAVEEGPVIASTVEGETTGTE